MNPASALRPASAEVADPGPSGRRVVIGCGPDGLRAAAVLAAAGHAVTFLQTAETPSGLRWPELPVDAGILRVPAADRAVAEQVVGSLVEAPTPERALLARGALHTLPLSRPEVGRLFPAASALPAAQSWVRSRFKNTLAELVGGGQEERSYKDWVVRRMGGPAWHHIYRAYAHQRWGFDGAVLGVGLARVYHGRPDAGPFLTVGGGPATALARAEELIISAGGRVRLAVKVERLVVEGGKVRAVLLQDGERIDVLGPLWAAVPAPWLASWLEDAIPGPIRSDTALLEMLPVARVALRGDTNRLPAEVHVTDEGAPFWRVIRPYGIEQTAIFHVTAPKEADDDRLAQGVAEAAAALGLGTYSVSGAKVERLVAWQPVWRSTSHTRLRSVLLAWRTLGIVAVGRCGAFAGLDAGEEISFAVALRDRDDPDQREVQRDLASPPVGQDDLHAAITRFIER
jgi:phytoene dehydrogenase-like protein